MTLRWTLWLRWLVALALLGSGTRRAEASPTLFALLTLPGEAPGVLHLVGEGFGRAGAPVRIQVDDRVVPSRVINDCHILCLGPVDLIFRGRLTVAVQAGACVHPLGSPPLQGVLEPLGVRVAGRQHPPLDVRFENGVRLAFASDAEEDAGASSDPDAGGGPGSPAVAPAVPDRAKAKKDRATLKRFGRTLQFYSREARLIQLLRAKAGQTVTREELLEAGWETTSSGRMGSLGELIQAMAGLARKLHGPREPDCLHEVPGVGYRLDLPTPPPTSRFGTGRHLTSYGRTVELSWRGAKLFAVLSANPGQAKSLADLTRAAWPREAHAAGDPARTLAELSILRLALRPPAGVDPLPQGSQPGTFRLDPACLQPAPAVLQATAPTLLAPLPLVLDPAGRRVVVNGVPSPQVPEQDWQLLAWLAAQGESWVTSRNIHVAVTGQDPGKIKNDLLVVNLAAGLRGIIDSDPRHPSHLQTEKGFGYRLLLGGGQPPSLYGAFTLPGEAPGVLHLVGEGFGGAGAPVRVQVEGRRVPARVINPFHVLCWRPADPAFAGPLTVTVQGGTCAEPLAWPPLQGVLGPSGVQVAGHRHPRFGDWVGLAFAPTPWEAAQGRPQPAPALVAAGDGSLRQFGRTPPTGN